MGQRAGEDGMGGGADVHGNATWGGPEGKTEKSGAGWDRPEIWPIPSLEGRISGTRVYFKASNSRLFTLAFAASAGFQYHPLVSQHWAKEYFSVTAL